MESTCPHLGVPLSHAELTTSQQIHPSTSCSSTSDSSSNASPNLIDESLLFQDEMNSLRLENPNLEHDGNTLLTAIQSIPTPPPEKTIICPWHLYDFDLEDGKSSTGMSVCVYKVELRRRVDCGTRQDATGEARQTWGLKVGIEEEGQENKGIEQEIDLEEWEVWVEEPDLDHPRAGSGTEEENFRSSWEVLNVLGVSEEFADPPPQSKSDHDANTNTTLPPILSSLALNSQILPKPLPSLPNTLVSSAILILQTASAEHKLQLTRLALQKLRSGGFSSIKPTGGDVKRAKALFQPRSSNHMDQEQSPDVGEGEKRGKLLQDWPGCFVPPREEGVKTVGAGVTSKRGKGGSEKSRVLMLRE